jgi:hypothetical protein
VAGHIEVTVQRVKQHVLRVADAKARRQIRSLQLKRYTLRSKLEELMRTELQERDTLTSLKLPRLSPAQGYGLSAPVSPTEPAPDTKPDVPAPSEPDPEPDHVSPTEPLQEPDPEHLPDKVETTCPVFPCMPAVHP